MAAFACADALIVGSSVKVDGQWFNRLDEARLRAVAKEAPLVHFWGDTHGQSSETLGTNTAREYFEFGRDKAFLDVMGHQGNDFQITGAFWRELNALPYCAYSYSREEPPRQSRESSGAR